MYAVATTRSISHIGGMHTPWLVVLSRMATVAAEGAHYVGSIALLRRWYIGS